MTTSLRTQRVVPNKGKSSRMLRHMHVQYGSVSACQDGDASQTHRVSNARTVTHIIPNYWTSPKEKNQYCSYPNTKSTAEFFRPLTVLHLRMFLICDAKFHPAVHGKPSVTVALLMEHIAFLPLTRAPGVFSCSSTSFVCIIQICLTVFSP